MSSNFLLNSLSCLYFSSETTVSVLFFLNSSSLISFNSSLSILISSINSTIPIGVSALICIVFSVSNIFT
ncbi:unnamed protein product [Meloidogyne enterolobii]|uniref:Uncharacterized protein n=1 Tax=Meloidogyne enterolobii TaxID=390850 RepID=A0ACB1AEZ7_MELEN